MTAVDALATDGFLGGSADPVATFATDGFLYFASVVSPPTGPPPGSPPGTGTSRGTPGFSRELTAKTYADIARAAVAEWQERSRVLAQTYAAIAGATFAGLDEAGTLALLAGLSMQKGATLDEGDDE